MIKYLLLLISVSSFAATTTTNLSTQANPLLRSNAIAALISASVSNTFSGFTATNGSGFITVNTNSLNDSPVVLYSTTLAENKKVMVDSTWFVSGGYGGTNGIGAFKLNFYWRRMTGSSVEPMSGTDSRTGLSDIIPVTVEAGTNGNDTIRIIGTPDPTCTNTMYWSGFLYIITSTYQ